MPPLASCGTGSGRTYYWSDASVVEQARTAYDALAHYGRIDCALVMVWLSGFSVPLQRLRRALQNRRRRPPSLEVAASVLPRLFQEPTTKVLGPGGIDFQDRDVSRSQLVAMAHIYGAILENTDIIHAATDDQLLRAREYLGRLRNETQARSDHDTLVHLLVFILGLLHAGQAERLDMLTTPPHVPGSAHPGLISAKAKSRLQIAS